MSRPSSPLNLAIRFLSVVAIPENSSIRMTAFFHPLFTIIVVRLIPNYYNFFINYSIFCDVLTKRGWGVCVFFMSFSNPFSTLTILSCWTRELSGYPSISILTVSFTILKNNSVVYILIKHLTTNAICP